MLKNLALMALVICLGPAKIFAALNLRTERNPVCGVELYEERFDGDVCGWIYFEKQSDACPLDPFIAGADLSCQGSDPGGRKISAELNKTAQGWSIAWWSLKGGSTIQGSEDIKSILGDSLPELNPGNAERETSYWKCKASSTWTGQSWYGGISCTTKLFADVCELEKFGKIYKSCRAASHGNESPKKCRSDKFNAEIHNSCSFYKTPEEIDAYIDATYSSLAINSSSLPSKQADLYASFRQEASFICLIEKYKDLEGFDVVFDDLVKKFKDVFTYDYMESNLSCADAANESKPLKITAGNLDCAAFTLGTLKALVKPESMNLAVFSRFKSTCSTKLSYELAVNWFEDKLSEIGVLLEDVVARANPMKKTELINLKQSVSDSK